MARLQMAMTRLDDEDRRREALEAGDTAGGGAGSGAAETHSTEMDCYLPEWRCNCHPNP